jgi:hypothetical protein
MRGWGAGATKGQNARWIAYAQVKMNVRKIRRVGNSVTDSDPNCWDAVWPERSVRCRTSSSALSVLLYYKINLFPHIQEYDGRGL